MRIGKEENNPIISKRYESLYKISFKNIFSMRMLKKGAPVGRDTEGTDFPKHPLSNTPVNKGNLLPALYFMSGANGPAGDLKELMMWVLFIL